MQKEIKHTLFFQHSPKDVWEYLTQPALMAQWLMKNDFEPVVGHKFKFTTNPMPQFDFDGIIDCEVVEVSPYEKLSYTWKGGGGAGIKLDSLVVWTLRETDNGTELALVHSGFSKVDVVMFGAMDKGWWTNMNKILHFLNDKADAKQA